MRYPGRIIAGLAAASLAAAGLAAATLVGHPLAHAAAVPAQITVQPGTPGNAMPAGFAGFSIPPAQLAVNDFANTHLAAYLKTLGSTGVIRIGGNSGDTTFWTSTGEAAPSWATGTITPASLQSLASVAQASGWRVILSVNLKHNDPARAADEAKNAQQILGSSLLGIEIGNEPTFYYTSTSAYFHDFEAYAAAIKQAAPGVGLIGPDPDHNHPDFISAFASNEAASPDVAAVTNHTYPTSACSGSTATVSDLLSTNSMQNESDSAKAVVSGGQSATCAGDHGRDQLDGLRRGSRRE